MTDQKNPEEISDDVLEAATGGKALCDNEMGTKLYSMSGAGTEVKLPNRNVLMSNENVTE